MRKSIDPLVREKLLDKRDGRSPNDSPDSFIKVHLNSTLKDETDISKSKSNRRGSMTESAVRKSFTKRPVPKSDIALGS